MQISNYVINPIYTKYSDELYVVSNSPSQIQGKPVVNFMDYYEKASANAAPQQVDYPVMQFPDYSNLPRFPSTGDAVWDSLIDLGLDYSESCFDFTNSRDFKKLTAEEDFTGMSKLEKYKAIYEKYQHCYGENFLNSDAINYLGSSTWQSKYERIVNRFFKEAAEACGGYDDLRNLHKKALYGDMSDYDVRQAIIDKYVVDGNVTISDFYKMTYEMDRCGVGAGVHTMVIRFDFEEKNGYPSEDYYEREKRLNDNVSGNLLKDMTTLRGVPSHLIQSDYGLVIGQIRNSLNV